MPFKVTDKKLLKSYTKIWKKSSRLMNTKFDSDPIYGGSDKHKETKIKSYGDKINTNLHGRKIPKENTSYKRLLLIMLGSGIRVNTRYYPQTLLEECKYEIKRNKMENIINDDLDPSSSDNKSDNEPDDEADNESND